MKIVFPIALIILVLYTTSCSTIAGPPESAGDITQERGVTFPYDRYVEGKPSIDLRVQGGFYIWKIGNTWYVRIAKKPLPKIISSMPVLTGNIRIENALAVDLRRHEITPANYVNYRKDRISFKFEMREDIGNQIEGFDFKVQPTGFEYCITLDLKVNGELSPEIVYLGSFMHTIDRLPLTICLHSF